MPLLQLKIEGMTCGGCAKSITTALQSCRGVRSVIVDHNSGLAEIDFDPEQISVEQIKTAVAESGFDVIG